MAELSEAEKKSKYDSAKQLFESVECLETNKYKVKMCNNAAKRFEELGDYEDSAEMAKKCHEMADLFAAQHDPKIANPVNPMEKKEPTKFGTWMFRICFVLVILIVVGIILSVFTKEGRYMRASAHAFVGDYKKAYQMFDGLDGYKDSEERFEKLQNKHAKRLMYREKYKDIKNDIKVTDTYGNNGEILCQAEINLIKRTKIGEKVTFGDTEWLLAEKQKDKAFLIKSRPESGIPYNTERKPVTWKTSSIRNYLNSTFLHATFNKEMISHIMNTNIKVEGNDEFKTKGCKTTDKIFMLNELQVYKYGTILSNFKRDFWILSPGDAQDKAQFVSFGEVMDDGYSVDSPYINIRPCLWVTYN
ncbi:MAG: hypothetical protein IJF94_04050 [Eubacterium sp.]|nr:hypothetical protein [Eubacterium sp.]